MTFKHFLLIGALGLFGLVVTLVMSNVSRTKSGGGPKGIAMDADDLFEAFRANPEKAEKEFKGKVLEVSGTVTESMHGFALKLDTGVLAMASRTSDNPFKGLDKGDRVTVRGTCAGFQDREIVHLQDCELVTPLNRSP